MGVLGILPFVLFFGTGVLSKQDLNNFLWTVVILAMGGLVLGEAVKTSGLLDVIAEEIADAIEYHSLSLWCTLCIFTFLILVCTTFVSHTVGAIVVIPIVQAVGYVVYPSCPRSFIVFSNTLLRPLLQIQRCHATHKSCQGACLCGCPRLFGGHGLARVRYVIAENLVDVIWSITHLCFGIYSCTGFPNMTAVSVEDSLGNRFVNTSDFLRYAVLASVFSWGIIVTMGYWLITIAVEMER